LSSERYYIPCDYDQHHKVCIAIDVKNADTILPFLYREDVDKEFKIIRALLKENLRNREKYCKCNVSNKAEDIFEMRFTSKGRNDRIYCKEMSDAKQRIIIMIELFEGKKSQNIPKEWKLRIESMGKCQYKKQP
jgi:Trp operon repressor